MEQFHHTFRQVPRKQPRGSHDNVRCRPQLVLNQLLHYGFCIAILYHFCQQTELLLRDSIYFMCSSNHLFRAITVCFFGNQTMKFIVISRTTSKIIFPGTTEKNIFYPYSHTREKAILQPQLQGRDITHTLLRSPMVSQISNLNIKTRAYTLLPAKHPHCPQRRMMCKMFCHTLRKKKRRRKTVSAQSLARVIRQRKD